MKTWRSAFVLSGAALAAAVVSAGPPTTQPADLERALTAALAAPTTRAVVAIPQPETFLALAAKARRIEGVYVKGRGVDGEASTPPVPEELREFAFEIWAGASAAKTRLALPSNETRVSDGKHVYTFRLGREGPPQARRRKITPANLYHAVDLAAIVIDAIGGYANLTASVAFVPASAPAGVAKPLGELKWFRLTAASKPTHHLLENTTEVKAGISPEDGLVRILWARLADKKGHPTFTLLFETIRCEPVKPERCTLPPRAAEAKWIDADTGESIPAPQQVIAARKI